MNAKSAEFSRLLLEQRLCVAEAAVFRQYAAEPELEARYGKNGREKSLQDALFNVDYLAEAIASDNAALFGDYIAWLKVTLAKRNVPSEIVERHLEILREAIHDFVSSDVHQRAAEIIEFGLDRLQHAPDELPSFFSDDNPLAPLSHAYLQSLLHGNRKQASQLILDAVKRGTLIKDIYIHVFQRSQHELGRLWQINQISVAQEHLCTAATQLIMAQLYTYIFASEKIGARIVATCVGRELHEIGIRMVADFFEMEGWDTYYLGANTPTEAILKSLIDNKAHVLAISTTITYHVRVAAALIESVRGIDALRDVKILVGGYPFNAAPDLWRTVGADGYARDAVEAIPLAAKLIHHSST